VLRFLRTAGSPGEWSGDFHIADSSFTVAGLALPVRVASAAVAARGSQVTVEHIEGKVGEANFTGEYRYVMNAPREHRFHLNVPRLDATRLERLLAPTLRRSSGFLTRALRLGRSPQPAWLRERRAEGAFEIEELQMGDFRFENVKGRLVWSGSRAELLDLEAGWNGGSLLADLSVDLTRGAPAYHLNGSLQNLPWLGGVLEGGGHVEAAGSGSELLLSLKSLGWLEARSLHLADGVRLENLAAEFELLSKARSSLLQLSGVDLVAGGARYRGQGFLLPDGKLVIEMTGAGRELRLAGALTPPELRLSAAPEP
jgi:hypothetical protein